MVNKHGTEGPLQAIQVLHSKYRNNCLELSPRSNTETLEHHKRELRKFNAVIIEIAEGDSKPQDARNVFESLHTEKLGIDIPSITMHCMKIGQGNPRNNKTNSCKINKCSGKVQVRIAKVKTIWIKHLYQQ